VNNFEVNMKIYDSISSLHNIEKGWALTIGNFDGVHLGHRQIIAATVAAAKKFDTPGAAVMTFDPHPAVVLHPEKNLGILTPLTLKKHLLQSLGVDCLILIKDSLDLLNLSPKDFIDNFLMATIRPRIIIEGPNFNFGYGRSGDINTLKELSPSRGFEVIEVPPRQIKIDDGPQTLCSSSLIRGLLEKGSVKAAAEVLGTNYRLIGKTIPGRGIGKEIGFPTANINPANQIVPAEGVYAGFVATGDNISDAAVSTSRRAAAFSIGRAKTFLSANTLLVEAHILEQNVEDLAGKCLAMDFVKKIRNQQRFDNKEQLKNQIARDCKITKQILADNV
jgi:riboflavin kinase/FMN adenylyltransferase